MHTYTHSSNNNSIKRILHKEYHIHQIIQDYLGIVVRIELFIDRRTKKAIRIRIQTGTHAYRNLSTRIASMKYDSSGRVRSIGWYMKTHQAEVFPTTYGGTKCIDQKFKRVNMEWNEKHLMRLEDSKGNWWDRDLMQTSLPFETLLGEVEQMYSLVLRKISEIIVNESIRSGDAYQKVLPKNQLKVASLNEFLTQEMELIQKLKNCSQRG